MFEKDFIIVPINEKAHWYVCIICFPSEVTKNPANIGEDKPEKKPWCKFRHPEKYSPIVPHNNLYIAVKIPTPDPSLSPSTKAVLRQAGQGEVSRAISREIDTMAKRPTRRGENN